MMDFVREELFPNVLWVGGILMIGESNSIWMVVVGWWGTGYIITTLYQLFKIYIVDTNVRSYLIRSKILFSFLGPVSVIIVPLVSPNVKLIND